MDDDQAHPRQGNPRNFQNNSQLKTFPSLPKHLTFVFFRFLKEATIKIVGITIFFVLCLGSFLTCHFFLLSLFFSLKFSLQVLSVVFSSAVRFSSQKTVNLDLMPSKRKEESEPSIYLHFYSHTLRYL